MDMQEKVLYHQIHPAKLAADIGGAFISYYFFWVHQPLIAIAAAFLPAIIGSIIVIRFADIEKIKMSPFGRRMKNMSRGIEGLRFAGYIISAAGAWYNDALWIFLGLAFVAGCWVYVLRG